LHDIEDALGALQYCVEAKGRGHRCEATYVDLAQQPACLIGMAWSVVGVTQAQLTACGHSDVMRLAAEGTLPLEMTMGALAVYDEAQRVQDFGDDWGTALDYATELAKDWDRSQTGELIDA
jgi:hypothetical protein